jgi:general secretion pathway protein J
MTHGAPDSSDDAGFTLVEALVALSLVGLITLVAFTGLRLAGDAWARTDRQSQVVGEVTAVQRLLRDAIEQAYPGIVSVAGAPTELTFRGEAVSLERSAPIAHDLSPGGRHRLHIVHAAAENSLILGWMPERNQKAVGGLPAASRQVTLATGIRAVSFSYFGQLANDREPRWHREWIGQPALPQLVRVEATLVDGRLARWPVLDAAPRSEVDATCVLDLLTRRCRGR